MIPAPLPDNEAYRLAALQRYKILDSAPERAFDDITFVASQIFGTPIALVSLVDEHRQWFKSKVGLEASETHRNLAFCAHAIHEAKPFVISDASQDPRFHDNPLVTHAPDIRFYAGSPLTTPDGFHLGTLCVIDTKPRSLPPEMTAILDALARQVCELLELRRTAAQLAEALENVQTLESLLPICAYCKGIRDDQGTWQKLEQYISAHSNTRFSHGICTNCLEKHVRPYKRP